ENRWGERSTKRRNLALVPQGCSGATHRLLFCVQAWTWKLCPMKKTDVENEKQEAGVDSSAAPEPLVTVDAATIAPEQLEELKQRAAASEEHWQRLLRTTADFENFKKRAAREKQEAIKFANESLLQKL